MGLGIKNRTVDVKPRGPPNTKCSDNNSLTVKLGTWNVRTLCPGIPSGRKVGEIVPTLRKTAVIARELHRLRVDIAALQETRLPESGSLREDGYTFYWKGLGEDEPRYHGVGFAVSERLARSITTPVGVSERIMSLSLTMGGRKATIVCVYAPTLKAPQAEKDLFYEQLSEVVASAGKDDDLWVIGDFNARVGQDTGSWSPHIGHHGVGKLNENGQLLLEFCTKMNLCVTNTFFELKPQHKVTWRHPRSGHWHQLDLVLTRTKWLNSVKSTRAYHSADGDTDHALVISRVQLSGRKRKPVRVYTKPAKKVDVSGVKNPLRVLAFSQHFKAEREGAVRGADGSPDEVWASLKNTIHDSSVLAYGLKTSMRHDWMGASADKLVPLLEEKRQARLSFLKNRSATNEERLRASRANVQREARKCANQYWTDLCVDVQLAANRGDASAMYAKIKQATGPTLSKCAPLKSASGSEIHDRSDQMGRWVEHYSELYGTSQPAHPGLRQALPKLPVMEELDTPPTMAELKAAIMELNAGKACGEDGIPAEILQANSDALLPELHELLSLIWETGVVPHEMRNAKIVTLYKNKGDRGDCNNYRGISLLNAAGKAYARILLRRLQSLAERILPDSQCGFRAGRSTTDMVFTLRQLQEKCREQNRPLYLAFVDLTKAFDSVSREALYETLRSIGCPPNLLRLVASFHDEMKGRVQFEGCLSEEFDINIGVKQGCVLAPTLFGIYFAALLDSAFGEESDGVYVRTRTDGNLFNVQRLRWKKMTTSVLLRELLFADDAALVSHNNY